MKKIIISTTFRDFDGSDNDKMQIGFLKSLKRQTFQDFMLVATVFGEKKVEKIVKSILGDRAFIIHDSGSDKYRFSLSKTFMNGVDYGLANDAAILVDCSSDIILQSNFLDVVSRRIESCTAGISHPNIFYGENEKGKIFFCEQISQGIDIRFFSIDLFRKKHVYELLSRFPSYDYGAGIETILCGLAIKYAKKRYNIFTESKVLKRENDRDGQVGVETEFVREGYRRNHPTVKRFLLAERLSERYIYPIELNKEYKLTKGGIGYKLWFSKDLIKYKMKL